LSVVFQNSSSPRMADTQFFPIQVTFVKSAWSLFQLLQRFRGFGYSHLFESVILFNLDVS
jgi:hypothetical protein